MVKYMVMMLMAAQASVAEVEVQIIGDNFGLQGNTYFSETKQVAENIWIGPQPTEDDFKALVFYGIDAVVNNRTKAELSQLDFSEDELANKHNMTYDLLEIGKGHEYSPAKLTAFNDLMTANADNNILLHCRSGHRSTQLYTAWLIKYQDKSPAEALKAVGSTETELNDSVKALLSK